MIHVLEVKNPRVVEVLTREQSLIELGRMNVGERTEQVEKKEERSARRRLDASQATAPHFFAGWSQRSKKLLTGRGDPNVQSKDRDLQQSLASNPEGTAGHQLAILS